MFVIQEVSGSSVCFGGDVKKLMPPMEDIPAEFKDQSLWTDIAGQWFFGGLNPRIKFHPKKGVDTNKAIKHLRAILVSRAPSHEHKEAGVAFLLHEWFDKITNWEKAS